MKTIYEFKKGDEIVRITSAKPLIDMMGKEIRDRSYLGEKMIFAGIANGQIYLKRTDYLSIHLFGDKLVDLPLDLWDDGWDNWIDPEELLENIVPVETLLEKLEKALRDENYELADKIKNLLNKK
tara:strand:+ start:208 stop:582 length:375 start_codon:yes stop_codon:yes gene_type:complete